MLFRSDYQVDECPMAEGNRHLGYKEVLNGLEERSPGTKAAFLASFFSRGHEFFRDAAAQEQGDRLAAPDDVGRAGAGQDLEVAL